MLTGSWLNKQVTANTDEGTVGGGGDGGFTSRHVELDASREFVYGKMQQAWSSVRSLELQTVIQVSHAGDS